MGQSVYYQLHVVGGEEAVGAVQLSSAPPPALVNLLNVDDLLVHVKGQLSLVLCREPTTSEDGSLETVQLTCLVVVQCDSRESLALRERETWMEGSHWEGGSLLLLLLLLQQSLEVAQPPPGSQPHHTVAGQALSQHTLNATVNTHTHTLTCWSLLIQWFCS